VCGGILALLPSLGTKVSFPSPKKNEIQKRCVPLERGIWGQKGGSSFLPFRILLWGKGTPFPEDGEPDRSG